MARSVCLTPVVRAHPNPHGAEGGQHLGWSRELFWEPPQGSEREVLCPQGCHSSPRGFINQVQATDGGHRIQGVQVAFPSGPTSPPCLTSPCPAGYSSVDKKIQMFTVMPAA